MNTRILELVEQCYNLPNTPEALYYRKFDEQKLAELILGECIKTLADNSEFRACAIIVKHLGTEP